MRCHPALRSILAPLALALLLAACGGEGEPGTAATPVQKSCDNTVPAGTGADDPACGDVLVEVTDADGDFLAYEVDVVALRLARADGVEVALLPNRARIDFAQLVQLTELLTAARVPPGVYTRVEMTLDYRDSRIVVERGGEAVEATVVSPPLTPICVTTPCDSTQRAALKVRFSPDRPLVVAAGTPALLTLDFDLAASNQVNLGPTTPTVTVKPVLVATVDRALDDREHRVRGPLLEADATSGVYLIALRPGFRVDGHFGRMRVHTSASTEFEVDGVAATGGAGFALLAAEGQGTATVAFGRYDPTLRAYLAERVVAGEGVPGGSLDGAFGAVRARSGDSVTLSGGTLVRASGQFGFAHDIVVALDPVTTSVRVAGQSAPATLAAISVGSRIEVLGNATEQPDGSWALTATFVRVVPSVLTGTVLAEDDGTLTAALQSLDFRRVELFDFAGTGVDAANDADPAAYEIELGALDGDGLEAGDPIAVGGLVAPFGAAPADFQARTLVDFSSVRAEILVGWGVDGTLVPFSVASAGELRVDLGNPALGAWHHLKRGPLFTDLAALPASPQIMAGEEPLAYAVRLDGEVQIYSSFGAFVLAVEEALAAGEPLRGFVARGLYDDQQNRLEAKAMLAVFD